MREEINVNVTINVRRAIYFMVQKLIGIIMIVASVATVPINDNDATICLVMVPLGLLLFFTRHQVMDLGRLGSYEEEERRNRRRVRR